MTKADGKGKWWEGLDPQDLYQQDHPLSRATWADGIIHQQWGWGNGAAVPSQKFVTNFYNRTLDVINRYNPDLLYFDVTVLPFWPISDCGLKIAADFYNHNLATHHGKLTAVMFGKILDDQQRKGITWDVERGAPNHIIDRPWQTCSCIGGWHYNTEIYEKNQYKSAAQVVKLLVDVVSKNGNLLRSLVRAPSLILISSSMHKDLTRVLIHVPVQQRSASPRKAIRSLLLLWPGLLTTK